MTTTSKDRSYRVREDIANRIGAPLHSDFAPIAYGYQVEVQFTDGAAGMLVDTSNAGFRGIEGWFQVADDLFWRSLGDVADFTARRV